MFCITPHLTEIRRYFVSNHKCHHKKQTNKNKKDKKKKERKEIVVAEKIEDKAFQIKYLKNELVQHFTRLELSPGAVEGVGPCVDPTGGTSVDPPGPRGGETVDPGLGERVVVTP